MVARLRGIHHYASGDTVTAYFPIAKLFRFDADGNTLSSDNSSDSHLSIKVSQSKHSKVPANG
ncbi:MAG: hypothetical protein ACJA2E_001326 [Arenicella sp.]|jgi:hypothetical protein